MQDKTGVTHLGFVSACVCLCENVCAYVHLHLYSLCFVCKNQRQGNNDVTEKHEKNCRNNNGSITIRRYKKHIYTERLRKTQRQNMRKKM